MPSGLEERGYSSTRSTGNEDCNSPLCALGNGEVDIILSKSSLTLREEYDPSALVDFFGSAVSATCVRSQHFTSVIGEPATPNGAGDCANSYSPVSAGWGYCYGQPSVGVRTENSSDISNLARRSCTFENDELSAYSAHSAPMPLLRGSRCMSSGYYGPGAASALPATTVLGASPSYVDTLPSSSGFYVERLERELSAQCAESQQLRRQVQERDEQLSALRAQMSRLQQGGHAQMRPRSEGALEGNPPGLLAQLQRARECLTQQEPRSPLPLTSDGDEAATRWARLDDARPSASAASAMPSADAGSIQPEEKLADSSLQRLDTPPHAHEALPPARSLSDELQTVFVPTTAPALAKQLLPICADADVLAAATPPNGSKGSLGSGKLAPAADVMDTLSPQLRTLLVAERRRTDGAHAALLLSSRQAQRLADQLAEAQLRAEQLAEELRDWRRACLENHRELVKQRRSAAAAGLRLHQ